VSISEIYEASGEALLFPPAEHAQNAKKETAIAAAAAAANLKLPIL
jgi:hypothetical protein